MIHGYTTRDFKWYYFQRILNIKEEMAEYLLTNWDFVTRMSYEIAE